MIDPLRYYEASWDDMDGHALTSVKDDLGDYGRFDGSSGKKLGATLKAMFTLDGAVDTDFVFTLSDWPLFSDRSQASLVNAALTGFSFHSVATRHIGRVLPWKYSLMNIAVVEDALNLDLSFHRRIKIRGREAIILVKPVISAVSCPSLDVFRLAESMSGIFVSECFVMLWSSLEFTGLEFREIPVA